MSYGHFDSANREYVITKPDTPAAWANYLGSPEYGAIITNAAGGYSFVKSGANGRVLRYRFNDAEDRPGRYVYLRDDKSGDFWSASWQPVGKPLSEYDGVTRHGTGYTRMTADYSGVHSDALYYVPLDSDWEVWRVTVTNTGKESRDLSLFGYAEFTNFGNYEQDQVNLQYTQFITRTYFNNTHITQTINGNCAATHSAQPSRFFGLAGAAVAGYCGDKDSFIGTYHNYSNPKGVVDGDCGGGKLNYNLNSCGALQAKLTLAPGASKTVVFLLGQKETDKAAELVERYQNAAVVDTELSALKDYWHGKLGNLKITTPDESFNNMINTWNAYQCFITFIWSRAASLLYCGLRNGYGYRDTVQDIQGIIHLAPEMAKEKIKFMLSAQVHHGGALPLVKFDHKAGHEDAPEDATYAQSTGHPSYRADDALWLFPTIWKYVAETGDAAFLDEVIPYATHGQDTVYNHLLKAIDFSKEHLGLFGLPAGLHADWNDCLRLGKKGVSVFVAFQLYYAFVVMEGFGKLRGDDASVADMAVQKERFGAIIAEKCWEDDRFVRGYTEDGHVVGSRTNREASMWLNPQSWAVISGFATKEQTETILETVNKELNTKYGLRLMTPSFHEHPFEGALALLFNPSTKENGGIFLQSQGWIILAEALAGHGDRAFEYYLESCPAAQNDIADIRKLEPYTYGQFTESVESPYEGRSHVHWLTGTASTVMVASVEGILGLRPDMNGLRLAPSIPSSWKGFTMEKNFRGKTLNIEVRNPNGKQSGCSKLTLNGIALEGGYIPAAQLKNTNLIVLEL
ncbi:N,N'-diacetylchitobiose phosphorylase [Clostridia bacterium]|nr:N,N'-diacetylchitobiose phosphorylase [Clostridia bacterium]